MSSLEEIAEAVETIKSNGNDSILIFHYVSSYPAYVIGSKIRNIEFLQKRVWVRCRKADVDVPCVN